MDRVTIVECPVCKIWGLEMKDANNGICRCCGYTVQKENTPCVFMEEQKNSKA